MAQYARKDAGIATVSAWSNRGELASFPRPGEDNPVPEFPEAVAEAAAAAPWGDAPELPAATGPGVLLRRAALDRLGGLDTHSFAGEHALDDFCRRAAAMGWRNILCPAAYLVRQPAVGPTLLARRVGRPGRALARLPGASGALHPRPIPCGRCASAWRARMDELARSGPQRDLFH